MVKDFPGMKVVLAKHKAVFLVVCNVSPNLYVVQINSNIIDFTGYNKLRVVWTIHCMSSERLKGCGMNF